MEEPLVNFETAKLATEKGFDIPQIYFYLGGDSLHTKLDYGSWTAAHDRMDIYQAPTQSLLQKWLRETHNIHIGITLASDYELNILIPYVYEIYIYKDGIYHVNREFYDTYEQALESGLFQSLNLVET